MNEKLKTIENIAELLHAEIKSCINSDSSLCNRAYGLLNDAMLDAIDIKRKIETARAWNITAKLDTK